MLMTFEDMNCGYHMLLNCAFAIFSFLLGSRRPRGIFNNGPDSPGDFLRDIHPCVHRVRV